MSNKNETEEKKGFWGEFKEFISRGNVMDMAVGIIIGAAFTSIVTSLVDDIISPIIGYLIGGINFSSFCFTFPSIAGLEPAVINYGVFIQAIVNFLITAFAVFCLVKGINRLNRKKDAEEEVEEEEAEPEPGAEEKLLMEIRDLLKDKQ